APVGIHIIRTLRWPRNIIASYNLSSGSGLSHTAGLVEIRILRPRLVAVCYPLAKTAVISMVITVVITVSVAGSIPTWPPVRTIVWMISPSYPSVIVAQMESPTRKRIVMNTVTISYRPWIVNRSIPIRIMVTGAIYYYSIVNIRMGIAR